MNNKKRYSIFFVALLLVICGVLFLTRKPKYEVATYGFSKIHNNIQFPWQNGDSVYFFSGSLFAKYNLADNSVTRLSDYLLINQDIDSIKWSEKSVLFRSKTSTKAYDDLSLSLAGLGASKADMYWWRYDFASKTYQLLQLPGIEDCQDLFPYSETSFVCLPLDTNSQQSKKITLLAAGAAPAELYSGDSTIHDGDLAGNTFYFVSKSFSGKDTLSNIDLVSKQKTDIFESKGAILSYKSNANGTVLAVWKELSQRPDPNAEPHDNQESDHHVALLEKGKVSDDQTISASRLNTSRIGGDLFIVEAGGAVHQADGGKLKQIIKEDLSQTKDVRYFVKNNSDFYFVTSQNALLSTKDLAPSSLRSLSTFDSEADNDPDSGLFINTPDENGKTLVQFYDASRPFSEQALVVEKILKEDFFEPSMFRFVWSLNSTSNEVPVAPKASVLK